MKAINMNKVVGTHDIIFVTLDTLRYDVAQLAFANGEIPALGSLLGDGGWEKRHSPGSFTYSAHQAFFAGFLPTPATPGRHPRLFAADFEGSLTTTENTCRFSEPDIVHGLKAKGYRTMCAGGVGFFNKQTGLGSVFPNMFDESHWDKTFSVTDKRSTENQISWLLDRISADQGLAFGFLNVSAIHQPNNLYLDGEQEDDLASHRAALIYVDGAFEVLLQGMKERPRPTFYIVCGDHGTAYGEDGFRGHRIGHSSVWDVPYSHFIVGEQRC